MVRRRQRTPFGRPVSGLRAALVWMALVAVSMQALAPLAHAAALIDLKRSLPPGATIICTLDGPRAVHLGSGGPLAPVDGAEMPLDPQSPQQKAKNACCLGGAVVALPAPDAPDVWCVDLWLGRAEPPLLYTPPVGADPPRTAGRPRAPPSKT